METRYYLPQSQFNIISAILLRCADDRINMSSSSLCPPNVCVYVQLITLPTTAHQRSMCFLHSGRPSVIAEAKNYGAAA